MRCFQPPADIRFYAGVDLHARSLFLVVLDHDGKTRFSRNLPAAPNPFSTPSNPSATASSSAASACTAGTGSPIAAARRTSPSPSATPGA